MRHKFEARLKRMREPLLRVSTKAARSKSNIALGALGGIRPLKNSMGMQADKPHNRIKNAQGVKLYRVVGTRDT